MCSSDLALKGRKSPLSKEQFKKIIEKATIAKYKKVICLETGEIFESIKEAEKKYNSKGKRGHICECCNNNRFIAYKKHWAFYKNGVSFSDVLNNLLKEEAQYKNNIKNENTIRIKKVQEKIKRKVICLETGEVFESSAAAEKKYDISHVANCCDGLRKTAGKKHWKHYE